MSEVLDSRRPKYEGAFQDWKDVFEYEKYFRDLLGISLSTIEIAGLKQIVREVSNELDEREHLLVDGRIEGSLLDEFEPQQEVVERFLSRYYDLEPTIDVWRFLNSESGREYIRRYQDRHHLP